VPGIVLLLAGWTTTAIAAWWVPAGLTETEQDAVGLRTSATLVGILIVVWGSGAMILALRRRQPFGAEASSRVPVWPLVFAVLLLAGLGARTVVELVSQMQSGWAGARSTVAITGAVGAVLGGILFLAGRARWGSTASSRGRSLVEAGASVLAAGAVAGVAVYGAMVWAPNAQLTATTAPPADAADLPETLTHEAWRVELPSAVDGVAEGGPGVIARTEDGLVALDGETGEERWRFQRTGAHTLDMGISPDGRTTVLQWAPPAGGGTEIVFLDTETGRELHREYPSGSAFGTYRMLMSADTYLGVQDADSGDEDARDEFTGYSLRTGEELWSYELPADCVRHDDLGSAFVGAAVITMECRVSEAESEIRFVAIDGRGDEAWRRHVRFPLGFGGAQVDFSRDGSAVSIEVPGGEGRVRHLIELLAGDDLPDSGDRPDLDEASYPDYRLVRSAENEDERLTVVTADGVTLGTVDPPCNLWREYDVSDRAVVCATGEDDGRATVRVNSFDGRKEVIRVDFGIDAIDREPGDGYAVVRAPGAWVVWSTSDPAPGKPSVIVGMR
jgi:hypothetical protein